MDEGHRASVGGILPSFQALPLDQKPIVASQDLAKCFSGGIANWVRLFFVVPALAHRRDVVLVGLVRVEKPVVCCPWKHALRNLLLHVF